MSAFPRANVLDAAEALSEYLDDAGIRPNDRIAVLRSYHDFTWLDMLRKAGHEEFNIGDVADGRDLLIERYELEDI